MHRPRVSMSEVASSPVSFEIADDGELVETASSTSTGTDSEDQQLSGGSPTLGPGPDPFPTRSTDRAGLRTEQTEESDKTASLSTARSSTSSLPRSEPLPSTPSPKGSPLSTFLQVFPTPPSSSPASSASSIRKQQSETLQDCHRPIQPSPVTAYCSPLSEGGNLERSMSYHEPLVLKRSTARLNFAQRQAGPRPPPSIPAPSVLSHSRSLPSVAWSTATSASNHSTWSHHDPLLPPHRIGTVYEDASQSEQPSFRPKDFSPPFHQQYPRVRSGTISSTSSTVATTKSSLSHHPFATLSPPSGPTTQIVLSAHYTPQQHTMPHPAHQVNLVSQADMGDDDETCPICVESLGFTFRLPGEKPHVVPECGHSLHEACFVAVYGPVPRVYGPRKLNLGVCGVCRKPMRIGDGDAGAGSNKLAMLMGTGGSRGPPSSPRGPGYKSDSNLNTSPESPDPSADDVLSPNLNAKNTAQDPHAPPPRVVIPAISIKSEHPSIARIKDGVKGKQLVTAVLSIQVPPAGNRGRYPPTPTTSGTPMTRMPSSSGSDGQHDQLSPQLPPSPRSASSHSNHPASSSAALVPLPSAATHDAFSHLSTDLKHRVQDYKAHGLDALGPIKLFDLLKVRKGSQIREFHVYLFQDALICISEEKKKGFRGFLSSSSSSSNPDGSGGKGVLKLKGRIFLRHVRRVFDSTIQGELSLTIVMEDESLDSFILTFKDRASHETWKVNVTKLMDEAKGGGSHAATVPSSGGASKVNKMMGAGAPPPLPVQPTPFSPASTLSSSRSEDHLRGNTTASIRSASTFTNFTSSSPITANHSFQQAIAPVHTPLDLTIVLSVPSPASAPASSAAALKTRLIRASIAFALSLMGPRDRVSIVTCELGPGGTVRKTPLLSPARDESRRRLEAFVETIGIDRGEDDKDEFDVPMNEERQDVVAAVNVGLDVVLQRKNKNTLAGMILICDTAESIKRAQMDLVLARLEAANVPIHAIGYGKAHDPSPLWMLSNNTNGSYTFVKEWYHLRDSLAGVIGGLMSIALTNMKVHLSCQDNEFRVHKISGTTQAVVSTNGKDVDIELRELRHGERKEILIELEIDFSPDRSSASISQRGSSEDLNHGLGIKGLSLEESDRIYEEQLIDEVPVVEVDCSFHDPAVGRSVARLAHPVLLTIAILPKATSPPISDPTVQRRKMELFASDMITRALLLASRKNWSQASRILTESKRMIQTVIQQLQQTPGAPRSKREAQVYGAVEALGAVVQDLETLQEGIDEQRDLFDRDHRNYAAQQAMILRGQKSWTTRTSTERLYCTEDTQQIIQLSGEWSART